MNKQALRKNSGNHVRLDPIAKRLDGSRNGDELPPIDDDWVLRVEDDRLSITNTRTGHTGALGFDYIHNFLSDATRGAGYGTLVLLVQVYIAGDEFWTRPLRH